MVVAILLDSLEEVPIPPTGSALFGSTRLARSLARSVLWCRFITLARGAACGAAPRQSAMPPPPPRLRPRLVVRIRFPALQALQSIAQCLPPRLAMLKHRALLIALVPCTTLSLLVLLPAAAARGRRSTPPPATSKHGTDIWGQLKPRIATSLVVRLPLMVLLPVGVARVGPSRNFRQMLLTMSKDAI